MADDSPTPAGNGFTVKDLLTQFVLPKLEGIDAKLDQKASQADLTALAVRVNDLERHGSAEAITALERVNQVDAALDGIVAWRNRMIGALGIVSIAVTVA